MFFLLLIQRPKKSSQNNKSFMSSHTGTYLLQILGHMQYIMALVFFFTQFDCEIGTFLKIDDR